MNTRFRLNFVWTRIIGMFAFVASDEEEVGGNLVAESNEEPIVCDMRRAWAMLKMFEEGGVRFPRHIGESLNHAAAAHEQRVWSPSIYRDFRDALAVLDSMMNRRYGETMPTTGTETTSNGWKVIGAKTR